MASHRRPILGVCLLAAASILALTGCSPAGNEPSPVKLCAHEVPERLCPDCEKKPVSGEEKK